MLGTITLFSLCVHSSPIGNEVKQERNLRVRKKKQKNAMRKREEGKRRKK